MVLGRKHASDLVKQISMGGGRAPLKTASGGTLYASLSGSSLIITDESGRAVRVTVADVNQSNGVIHMVDKLLYPT